MHEIRTSVGENRLSSPDRIRYQDYVTRLEGQGRGWVFETEGTVVAFGIADVEARSIWALFVEPGFEGRGIGRALLEAMTLWMFEQGDGPIWLTTAPATRAERFYRAAGWRETGRINGEIRFELSGAGRSTQAGLRGAGRAFRPAK
jgi:GNAT superfamily N-acetyltransferase